MFCMLSKELRGGVLLIKIKKNFLIFAKYLKFLNKSLL